MPRILSRSQLPPTGRRHFAQRHSMRTSDDEGDSRGGYSSSYSTSSYSQLLRRSQGSNSLAVPEPPRSNYSSARSSPASSFAMMTGGGTRHGDAAAHGDWGYFVDFAATPVMEERKCFHGYEEEEDAMMSGHRSSHGGLPRNKKFQSLQV